MNQGRVINLSNRMQLNSYSQNLQKQSAHREMVPHFPTLKTRVKHLEVKMGLFTQATNANILWTMCTFFIHDHIRSNNNNIYFPYSLSFVVSLDYMIQTHIEFNS